MLKVVKCEVSKVETLKTERTWERINKEDSRCSFVKRMGEKQMKKRKLTILALLCCIIVGVCAIPTKSVQAHRMWKKYTKVASGTYTIEYEYYDYKSWQQEEITLKLGKYFVLDGSVQNRRTERVYPANPLKLKFAKKCKFYNTTDNGTYRISKSKAKKILKKTKYQCYVTLDKFHVKKNKVDKVYLSWY